MRHQQKNTFYKQARTPDPHIKKPDHREGFNQGTRNEQNADPSKLFLFPCNYWKLGKCDWGWSCRFLHGVELKDDPRRPEYRGPPVDFTQFPRPVSSSSPYNAPHQSAMSPGQTHWYDQSKVKPYRKPCVKIVIKNLTLNGQIQTCQDYLCSNGIDILRTELLSYMTLNEAKEQFKQEQQSDYVLYIDTNEMFLLTPDHDAEPTEVNLGNVVYVILNDWDTRNNNFSLEMLELLTKSELEGVVLKLAPDVLDNINDNIQTLQNETADAIASTMTPTYELDKTKLHELRGKLRSFFDHLNTANFIIADIPVFSNAKLMTGEYVDKCAPKPEGISSCTQKMATYLIGSALSQTHICLSHINKVLGEYEPSKINLPRPSLTSPSMHQNPLCAPNCSTICDTPEGKNHNVPRRDNGRRLEPEFSAELPTEYSLSFRRNAYDSGYSPFDQINH